jgi:anti-anti-sigma factor
MNVKIDTKEKFTVITPIEARISANMTGELQELLVSYLKKDIPHLILNLKEVQYIDAETGEKIAGIQQQFFENNNSFIVCELQKEPRNVLEELELLDLMNVTPTESEAWDIAQMEEIERELLKDE